MSIWCIADFTKTQQRHIRYRLNNKLRLLDEVLLVFGVQEKRCDATAAQLPHFGTPIVAQLAEGVSFLKLMMMTDAEEVTLKIKAHFHTFQVPRTLGR